MIGFLAAGALGAWVPNSFWGRLFPGGSGAGAGAIGFTILSMTVSLLPCFCRYF